MTAPETDLVHYLGILEAVVAVLAIKSGLPPEAMMARAIEDITEQSGMETRDTERIIRERWQGRDLQAGRLVAQALPDSLAPKPVVAEQDIPEPVSMTQRFREYNQRRKDAIPEDKLEVTEEV